MIAEFEMETIHHAQIVQVYQMVMLKLMNAEPAIMIHQMIVCKIVQVHGVVML